MTSSPSPGIIHQIQVFGSFQLPQLRVDDMFAALTDQIKQNNAQNSKQKRNILLCIPFRIFMKIVLENKA
jgi:hypothetical protein